MNKNNNKILIIHPEDKSTDFLKNIYCNISDKEVISDCNISKSLLLKKIRNSDIVIMLGHGCPNGLFSNSFNEEYSRLIINSKVVYELRKKKFLMGIWCFASEFFKKYKLHGIASGMFISDIDECYYYSYNDVEEDTLNESNNEISKIIGESLIFEDSVETIFLNICNRINEKLSDNIISEFNLSEFKLL